MIDNIHYLHAVKIHIKEPLITDTYLQVRYTECSMDDYHAEDLTGQRNDRIRTESQELQPRTGFSFDLAGSRQHDVAL